MSDPGLLAKFVNKINIYFERITMLLKALCIYVVRLQDDAQCMP